MDLDFNHLRFLVTKVIRRNRIDLIMSHFYGNIGKSGVRQII